MNKSKKQITFDIDTKIAEIILGKNYNVVYYYLREFLKDSFVHIEGSVYMSEEPMTNMDISLYIDKLKGEYPYLDKMVRAIHQSDISNVHSILHYFNYDESPGIFANYYLLSEEEKEKLKFIEKSKQAYNPLSELYTYDNLITEIKEQISKLLEDNFIDISIKDVMLSGSRCRGLEESDSDIDIILHYEGDIKEDILFNILSEFPLVIESQIVDINPIRNEEHDFVEYLRNVEEYLENKHQQIIENKTQKTRLFVDIDGTLAVFKPVDTLETLYEKGYFLNLEPHENVVAAVNELTQNDNIEVFIMSSVLSDSKYALDEKNEWINKYLPQIDMEHRIFPPCGSDKKEYIPEEVRDTDCLLDDYTQNLTLWQPPAKGIKLLNGINHTHGTWQHDRLDYNKPGHELAKNIIDIIETGVEIKDIVPINVVEVAKKMTPEEVSALISGMEFSIDYRLEIDENDFKLYQYLTSEEYTKENEINNILYDKEVPSMNNSQSQEKPLSDKEQQKNEMIESIALMAEEYTADPDKLIELFRFKEQFYNYSLNNSFLIAMQNPHALFVGSYKKFKDMGYNVKRGEHGMKILVPQTLTRFFDGSSWKNLKDATPEEKQKIKERASAEQSGKHYDNDLYKSYKRNVFGIGHVFDIAQTDCPAEKYPEIVGLGYSSEQHKQLFDSLAYFSQVYLNCPVSKQDFSSAALRGLYRINERRIEISSLLQDTQALSTLTHEMGHAILHNDRSKSNVPTCQKELEADALSIMLDIHLGLEVPDARRSHLHEHFCKFNNYREEHKDDENVPTVIDVLNNVEKIYRNVFDNIDNFIENTINKDLSQQKIVLPDKYPFVLFPYSEADIDNSKIYNIKDADELIHSLNNDYLQNNLELADTNKNSITKPTNFVMYLAADEIVTGDIPIGHTTGGLINYVEQIPDIPSEEITKLWNTKDHIIAAEYLAKSKECALENNLVEAEMYDNLAQAQKQNVKNRLDYYNLHGHAGEKDFGNNHTLSSTSLAAKKIDKSPMLDR